MEKAQLPDIANYALKTEFTDDEIAIIRSMFNGDRGEQLIGIIRKALLPTISDPSLPLEAFGKDMFMSAIDFRQMQTEEVKPIVLGLQFAAKMILGGLIRMRDFANVKDETEGERKARLAKNSSR